MSSWERALYLNLICLMFFVGGIFVQTCVCCLIQGLSNVIVGFFDCLDIAAGKFFWVWFQLGFRVGVGLWLKTKRNIQPPMCNLINTGKNTSEKLSCNTDKVIHTQRNKIPRHNPVATYSVSFGQPLIKNSRPPSRHCGSLTIRMPAGAVGHGGQLKGSGKRGENPFYDLLC